MHRNLLALVLVGGALLLGLSGGACADCGEGRCECADGTEIRVASAPCECRSVCREHGGTCADDFAGCSTDAGDASDASDAGDEADAWPFPWDAAAG